MRIITSIVCAAVFCLQPVDQVFARPEMDDTGPPQVTPLPEGARLERLFLREHKVHEKQQETLNKAAKAGEKLSVMIARAKRNGKDTRPLEKALADFNTRMGETSLIYNQTDRLIKQHAGFDEPGKVTDPEKAGQTVREVHAGNQEVRKSLARNLKDVKDAMQQYRKANPRPIGTPGNKPV